MFKINAHFIVIILKCLYNILYVYVLMLGTYIYNETDGTGWCFTSFCNVTCHVEKRARSCLSTTPPSATTTSPTTSEASSTPPPPHDCYFVEPPRKVRYWNINQIEGMLIHQHTLTNDICGKYSTDPDTI